MTVGKARPPTREADRQRVQAVLGQVLGRAESVDFAFGFGSFFEGLPYRDIDITTYPAAGEPLSLRAIHELATACERAVGVPVDIVDLSTAPLTLRYAATRGVLLFARDDETAATFMERTWLAYSHFQPILRQRLQDRLNH
ncbi:MAG TPA: nucleotidyltransferase domain-containing protein [Thermaerobacter sp.]